MSQGKVLLVQLESQELQVHQVSPDQQEHQEREALWACQVTRDHKGCKD